MPSRVYQLVDQWRGNILFSIFCLTVIMGYPSEDLRTCVGFQMRVDVVCVLKVIYTILGNCLQSIVAFQYVFVVLCFNISTRKSMI